MFPSILKQSHPMTKQDNLTDDRVSVTLTVQDESEESWATNKEESYNMEFNVEPKISASSKQSSRLTKQSLHCDSFENVVEGYGDNEWKNYYDEMVQPDDEVEDYAKDIFIEIDQMHDKLSDNDSVDSQKYFSEPELSNSEKWNKKSSANSSR